MGAAGAFSFLASSAAFLHLHLHLHLYLHLALSPATATKPPEVCVRQLWAQTSSANLPLLTHKPNLVANCRQRKPNRMTHNQQAPSLQMSIVTNSIDSS